MKTKKELLKEYINHVIDSHLLNESDTPSYTKEDLCKLVRGADSDQFYYIHSHFLDLGFYQDDRRRSKRKFVLDCIENCFKEDPQSNYDEEENKELIKAVLDGINHKEILANAYKGLNEIAYARDVTHEELNNNPVVLTTYWTDKDGQTQSNTHDFNNLKELFSWVNECGGFRQAFNGIKWSIRSDYKDGEFYLKRDKYARGGWRWTDVNGYNVEHLVRKIRGLREDEYWEELEPAVEQGDYDLKCIEYWKEQIQKGNHRPILVNADNEILDGNHTLTAYQELGVKPPMLYRGERKDFYPAASKANWDAMKAIYLMIDDGTATLIEDIHINEWGEETSEDIEIRELVKVIKLAYPKMDLSKYGINALRNIAKSAEKKLFKLASEEAEKEKEHPLYKHGKNGEVYIRTDNGGYEKLDESELLDEANLKDLIDDSKATDPKRIKLAQSIYTEYKGIDSDGTLLFESDSQTRSNKSHKQRIFYDRFFELLDKVDENKEIDANDVVDILTGDLNLDCSCESFLYWAWAYKSWTNNYGLKKELRAPKRNNVALNGGCCKHLLSVLELINRSDSLFDQIAKDLNDLFQHYRKQAGIVDKPEKKEYIPVDDTQFARTAANLARKGKTNKKLHKNPKAAEYNITPDSE